MLGSNPLFAFYSDRAYEVVQVEPEVALQHHLPSRLILSSISIQGAGITGLDHQPRLQ